MLKLTLLKNDIIGTQPNWQEDGEIYVNMNNVVSWRRIKDCTQIETHHRFFYVKEKIEVLLIDYKKCIVDTNNPLFNVEGVTS